MLAHLKRWESVETKSPQMALIRKRLRVEMWMYDQVRGYHHLVWFSIVCILYHHHYMWFYIFSSSSRLSTLRKGRQKLRLTSMRYDRRDKSPLVMFYPLNLYKRCTYVVIAELPGAWHWGRQPEKEVHQRHPHRLKVIPGSHQCEFLTFEAAWFPEISSAILGFAENLFVSDFRGGPLGESKDSVDSVKPVIEKHFSNYLWTFSISTRIQSQRTAQLMDHLFAIMIGEQFLICDLKKKLWGESQ